jgi:hypothetical protein
VDIKQYITIWASCDYKPDNFSMRCHIIDCAADGKAATGHALLRGNTMGE